LDHVLQAAEFRGELYPLRQAWVPVWLAVTEAQAEGTELDQEVLDQLATDFRYTRNLVTADECEQWLAALGVTSDEFADHFVRLGLAGPSGLFADTTQQNESAPLPAVMDPDMARSFRVDWLLSDEFPEMARALAWRVALQCDGRPAPDDGDLAVQRRRGLANQRCTGLELEDWLAQGEGATGWFDELPVLEALFQAESQAFLTPRNQQRALAGLRLPLFRFELEVLELESQAAAGEAFLCVTEDGIPLSELAAQNHQSLHRVTSFLEDLPEDWQQPLLSASPGQALPPFAVGDGFQLCRLLAKQDPVLTDPGVLARVNTSLLRGHFQELEQQHIQWQVNLEVEP